MKRWKSNFKRKNVYIPLFFYHIRLVKKYILNHVNMLPFIDICVQYSFIFFHWDCLWGVYALSGVLICIYTLCFWRIIRCRYGYNHSVLVQIETAVRISCTRKLGKSSDRVSHTYSWKTINRLTNWKMYRTTWRYFPFVSRQVEHTQRESGI